MKRFFNFISITLVFVTSITANAQNRLFLGDWYGRWNYSLYNKTLDRYDSGNGKTIVRIDLNGDSYIIRIKEVYSLPGEPEKTTYWPDLDIVSFDDQQITAQYESVNGSYLDNVMSHDRETYHFVLSGSVLIMTRDIYSELRDHSKKGWPIYDNIVYSREKTDPVKTGRTGYIYGRNLSELRLYKNSDW